MSLVSIPTAESKELYMGMINSINGCDACDMCDKSGFRDVGSGKIPAKYMFIGEAFGCFLPGTPIMGENNIHFIEDKLNFSKIMNDNRVSANLNYLVKDQDVLDIKPRGLPIISCTPNHKFIGWF